MGYLLLRSWLMILKLHKMGKLKKKEKVGKVYPGQRWVELHGAFIVPELKKILFDLEQSINKMEAHVNKN